MVRTSKCYCSKKHKMAIGLKHLFGFQLCFVGLCYWTHITGTKGLGLGTNGVHTDACEQHQGADASVPKSDLHFFLGGGGLSLFNADVSAPWYHSHASVQTLFIPNLLGKKGSLVRQKVKSYFHVVLKNDQLGFFK